jgi:hypothetical protein
MTLSNLIMSFVFTPIAAVATRFAMKRRMSKGPLQLFVMLGLPAIVTFVVMGAWHGEGWPYLAFGLFYGVLFALNLRWKKLKSRALTFLVAVLAFAIFHSASLAAIGGLFRGLAGLNGVGFATNGPWFEAGLWLTVAAAIVWLTPNTQELMGAHYPALEREKLPADRWAAAPLRWESNGIGVAASVAITLCGVLALSRVSSFVYFKF